MKTQPKKPATKVEKVIYIILGIIGTLVFPPIGVIIAIFLIANHETQKRIETGNVDDSYPVQSGPRRDFNQDYTTSHVWTKDN